MKSKILRTLRETDGFVSGQQLCDTFGVSRTAVWKAIDNLKKEGYEIEAVRNKGYRLVKVSEQMSKEAIKSLLKTAWMGQQVIYFDEIGSTNNEAKAAGDKGGVDGTLFVADMQTAGKGRRGREWKSPKGENIYMSLLLRPQIAPDQASMLTLVIALSLAQAVREMLGLDVGIKWPNDIVIGGKKICGILTEMTCEITAINYVVIGIGINVNQRKFPDDIKDTATSLTLEMGAAVDRSQLIALTLQYFETNYELFVKEKSLRSLVDAYNEICVNCGKRVRVLEPGNEYEADSRGINEEGELIVRTDDGKIRHIYAGEVSVRGIYGYV